VQGNPGGVQISLPVDALVLQMHFPEEAQLIPLMINVYTSLWDKGVISV
jgi:hypothetical protein